MTDAERRLWYGLRGRQMNGAKFKRQQPCGHYVLDFVCLESKLVVEVDGGQHLDSVHDQIRDAWLRAQGFRVLRFWNDDVLLRTDAVLQEIAAHLAPSPCPSPARGEGTS
jgi:very-short-patch-repair endonuclease